MSKSEQTHRLAFAERQFEHFKLKVVQSQLKARMHMDAGELSKAVPYMSAAENYIKYLDETNDAIDTLRRAINGD